MNARFWIMTLAAEFARVTLRSGQSLSQSRGGATDEGYAWESMTLTFDGEYVTFTEDSDSRDCDGRMSRGSERVCHVSRLASVRNEWSGLMVPDWQDERDERRDYSAEAAGY